MTLEELFTDIDAHHSSEPCTNESEIDEFAETQALPTAG